MQVIINIKDTHVPELIDVFGENYQTQILDVDGETLIPNPQTKAQFANEQFLVQVKQQFIKRKVMNYRERQALQAVDSTEITE